MYVGCFEEGRSEVHVKTFDQGRIRTPKLATLPVRYGINGEQHSGAYPSVTTNTSHSRSRLSIQGRLRQGRSATLDQKTLCLTAQLILKLGSKAGRSWPLMLLGHQLAFSSTLLPSLEAACLKLLELVRIWFQCFTIVSDSELSGSLSHLSVKPT